MPYQSAAAKVVPVLPEGHGVGKVGNVDLGSAHDSGVKHPGTSGDFSAWNIGQI